MGTGAIDTLGAAMTGAQQRVLDQALRIAAGGADAEAVVALKQAETEAAVAMRMIAVAAEAEKRLVDILV